MAVLHYVNKLRFAAFSRPYHTQQIQKYLYFSVFTMNDFGIQLKSPKAVRIGDFAGFCVTT